MELHWGNRTMVAAATIVGMAAAKKAQQNVFTLYHSYNRTILLGFIWILHFHFKIDIGNRHSMQVAHSYKERIFHLFTPQIKTNLWMIWYHKLKLPLSAKYS